MKTPERIIYVPLGDKTRPDLERAAFNEAWKLSQEILEEEDSRGRKVRVGIESLQRLPGINPIYYLKKGIISLGGYLVKIEEVKIPSPLAEYLSALDELIASEQNGKDR